MWSGVQNAIIACCCCCFVLLLMMFYSVNSDSIVCYIYQINFPADGFISPTSVPQLEQLLPPREEVLLPEEGEEVTLVKIDPEEQARNRRQHMVKT